MNVFDDVAHHRLVYLVRHVGALRFPHIGLHAMRQRVKRSADDLLHGQRLGEVAVENGK